MSISQERHDPIQFFRMDADEAANAAQAADARPQSAPTELTRDPSPADPPEPLPALSAANEFEAAMDSGLLRPPYAEPTDVRATAAQPEQAPEAGATPAIAVTAAPEVWQLPEVAPIEAANVEMLSPATATTPTARVVVAPPALQQATTESAPVSRANALGQPPASVVAADPAVAMHASMASQLLEVFMEEATEMLDGLHAALETIEREPSAPAMSEARRTVHTLKGGARMCGLKALTELAHACEDIIGPVMPGSASIPDPMIQLLFEAEQEMRAALNGPNIGPGSNESMLALTRRLQDAHQATPVSVQAKVEANSSPTMTEDSRAGVEIAAEPPQSSPALGLRPESTATGEPPPEVVAQTRAGPAPAALPSTPAPSGLAAQLLEVFVEEAGEMLDTLHASLETIERGPSEPALIEARRTVHTIKGGARMCGRRAITELAHACEDIIGPITASNDGLKPDSIALLFAAEQEMRAALTQPNLGMGSDESVLALAERLRLAKAEAAPAPSSAAASTSTTSDIATETAGGRAEPAPFSLTGKSMLMRRPTINSVASPANRLAIDLGKVESLVAKVTEIVANRSASHRLVETLGGNVNEMIRSTNRLQSVAIGLQYQITSHGFDVTAEEDPDGLALETYGPIKQLMLQLQEAVADQQALVQATMDVVAGKRALAAVETRLDTELQGALLNMRLLPISQLRVRLDQVVRSAAATAGKEVRWAMEGQNVALDKHVCDRLFEPLMHLLRNAIDHGIESPEEREAKGKARTGRIVVHATVEANQAIVTVTDDGKGMDADKIAETAVARGLIQPAQVKELSQREKLELIFRPGFSTASQVTELSGRGMGMEIVREACTRMGGSVSITPRQAPGATITLQVPLSMSVVHSMVVRDAGRLLAIPAAQVVSVHLVPPTAITRQKKKGHVVRIGPVQLPLFHLPGGSVKPTANKEFEERVVLVVPYQGEKVAVVVDEIVEEEDQIVKPLPHLLQGVDRLLGAIVLGNGTPAPVLNLPPTLDLIARHEDEPEAAASSVSSDQLILVVDDSLTMRTALTQSLEHAGYVVETARDGQEALEHIRNNGLPNLITLDIEMPRMDGLEALYAIRHIPGGENLPIFMLSSRTGDRHMRTAAKMGATRYFTKPYHDSEFISAVQVATGAVLLTR